MTDEITDIQFMKRAVQLAKLGAGVVSPNPRVGCVIVYQGRIIGEGWHRKYGRPHAEVNAIESVTEKDLLSESTCYVTLEPCSHFGKTPPCADLLIKHNLKRIVIACRDSNPLVSGKGIEKLTAAGIQVVTGVLENEAREMNKRFFTFIEKKRPYIILKWAQTADGFIARENFDSKWISNETSRQLVHKWRTEEDAILVGPNTAANDNPRLNVRDWSGRNPVRVLVDRNLKVNNTLSLFDKSQQTIVYNTLKEQEVGNIFYVKLSNTEGFIDEVVSDLFQRKIQSLIVEGGATILNEFIKSGLWDEARIFYTNKMFESGISAPQVNGREVQTFRLQDDLLKIYANPVMVQ